MKIATFNVNGIRARLAIVSKWLEREAPDVLCLQETKVQDEDFPRVALEALGYHCTFWGQKAYNGVAVLTREKPEKVVFGFGDGNPDEEPRMITLAVSGLAVVNTYVPQGYAPDTERFRYKIAWLERLKAFFQARYKPDAPVVWVGDFNVAPEPKDVYDPEGLSGSVGFHPEERRALSDIQAWGFVDVFRKHDPDAHRYTFWDYRIPRAVKRGLGWRIDHVWATRPMAERSTASWIDAEPRGWERPSDHTFVVAVFEG